LSRPRSQGASKPARGAVRGASSRRAQPAAQTRKVGVPQAQSDIYTALLGISMAAMTIGCALLIFYWSGYEFKTTP